MDMTVSRFKYSSVRLNVHVWAKSVPAKCWKTIKVRQGHKGWLKVRLVKCRVRALIENKVGEEQSSGAIIATGGDCQEDFLW
jgi:hypothetical protein